MLHVVHIFAGLTSPFILIFILPDSHPALRGHFGLRLLLLGRVLLLSTGLWFGAHCGCAIFIALASHLSYIYIIKRFTNKCELFLIISVT